MDFVIDKATLSNVYNLLRFFAILGGWAQIRLSFESGKRRVDTLSLGFSLDFQAFFVGFYC